MIYKNKPECKTIATYVPVETYDALLQMANARTKKDGEWWSLSRVIRDILIDATEEQKQHAQMREMLLGMMEAKNGKRA